MGHTVKGYAHHPVVSTEMAAEETEKSLAASRPHRALAGRNIGKLIDQEQEGDEFYKSAYGGFEEESEDEAYEVTKKSNYLR